MKISNEKLAIGIPCSFPTVPAPFFRSFVHMERPDYVFIMKCEGAIDTLRNDIVEKALSLNATKLIMMDTDMLYHPKTIPRLLSHNLPIVGALCFRRYPPFDSIMLRIETDGTRTGYVSVDDWEEGALVEVDATGAGCLMFDMDVFRNMPRPWFRFQKDPLTGSVIGEDIGFCQDLKQAGYRIFVDTTVPSDHLTTLCVNRATNRLYRSVKIQQQLKALDMAIAKGANGNE